MKKIYTDTLLNFNIYIECNIRKSDYGEISIWCTRVRLTNVKPLSNGGNPESKEETFYPYDYTEGL